MKSINRSTIAPIFAVLFLTYGTITGHAVDAHLQDLIITWGAVLLSLGVSLWGIFKNHFKEVKHLTVNSVATGMIETAKAVETAATTIANETETLSEATAKTTIVNAGEGDVQK